MITRPFPSRRLLAATYAIHGEAWLTVMQRSIPEGKRSLERLAQGFATADS
jgi:hypothetical protein